MCSPESYLPMLNDNYIKEYKLYRHDYHLFRGIDVFGELTKYNL